MSLVSSRRDIAKQLVPTSSQRRFPITPTPKSPSLSKSGSVSTPLHRSFRLHRGSLTSLVTGYRWPRALLLTLLCVLSWCRRRRSHVRRQSARNAPRPNPVVVRVPRPRASPRQGYGRLLPRSCWKQDRPCSQPRGRCGPRGHRPALHRRARPAFGVPIQQP